MRAESVGEWKNEKVKKRKRGLRRLSQIREGKVKREGGKKEDES